MSVLDLDIVLPLRFDAPQQVFDVGSQDRWGDGLSGPQPQLAARSLKPLFEASISATGSVPHESNRVADGSAGAVAGRHLEALLSGGELAVDTPLVVRLLERFGTLGAVMAASADRLAAVPGVTQAMAHRIVAAREAARFALVERLLDGPILGSSRALTDYLELCHRGASTERFQVLFLDTNNRLIRDEILWEGTLDKVPVYPRELARRVLELNAAAVIVVQNRPSGDAKPTSRDGALSCRLHEALAAIDVELRDHLIVGSEIVSIKNERFPAGS